MRKSNFDNEMNICYAIHSDTLKFSKGKRHAINIRWDYFFFASSKFCLICMEAFERQDAFYIFPLSMVLNEANCKQWNEQRVLSDGIWPCLLFVYQRLITRLRKSTNKIITKKKESCGWSIFANCPSIGVIRSKKQRPAHLCSSRLPTLPRCLNLSRPLFSPCSS